MKESYLQLVDAACEARRASHSPYSGFKVGAALRGKSGAVYHGTNVENASIGLSICAERSAVCRAVTDGEKVFDAIAICAGGEKPTPPCGACRQFLLEFGNGLTVLLAGERGRHGDVLEFSLGELIPHAFETYVDPAAPGPEDPEGAS